MRKIKKKETISITKFAELFTDEHLSRRRTAFEESDEILATETTRKLWKYSSRSNNIKKGKDQMWVEAWNLCKYEYDSDKEKSLCWLQSRGLLPSAEKSL